jgi:gamma-glutamylcyclotransferase (GGCT)/AIG2-like uncharacterized protein YtfP
MNGPKKVFVYGTLRPDISIDPKKSRSWSNLLKAEGISHKKALIKDAKMYDRGYPFIVLDKQYGSTPPDRGRSVVGSLCSFKSDQQFQDILRHLDHVEGHPDFYTRIVTEAHVDGNAESCWVYIRRPSDIEGKAIEVPSGDWLTFERP